MSKNLEFVVGEGEAGSRLDVLLGRNYPDVSRSLWQKMIETGAVTVNGQPTQNTKLICRLSDVIEAETPIAPALTLRPNPTPLEIIYEDNDVVVVDKPAGLVVHPVRPGEASVAGSLTAWIEPDGSLRPGVVHRLDRDTSGVMILAKNASAKEFLMAQFKKRQVAKTYLALVWGAPKHEQAMIDIGIARDRQRGDRRKAAMTGKPSQTQYRVLHHYADTSLLEVTPLTGRTHQIRVHLAQIGTPIVGDKMYGNKKTVGLNRQFLHASRLEITLPSGRRQIFSGELPPELDNYLQVYNENK